MFQPPPLTFLYMLRPAPIHKQIPTNSYYGSPPHNHSNLQVHIQHLAAHFIKKKTQTLNPQAQNQKQPIQLQKGQSSNLSPQVQNQALTTNPFNPLNHNQPQS